MYSRALLHRSCYIDTAFLARRYDARSRAMRNLRFLEVRHDPRLLSILIPHHVTTNPILRTPPPILKGAFRLLHRWAYSVGTVGDSFNCARATYKDQPGRWWPPPREYPCGRVIRSRGFARCGFLGRRLVRDISAGCRRLRLQLRMPCSSVCLVECTGCLGPA